MYQLTTCSYILFIISKSIRKIYTENIICSIVSDIKLVLPVSVFTWYHYVYRSLELWDVHQSFSTQWSTIYYSWSPFIISRWTLWQYEMVKITMNKWRLVSHNDIWSAKNIKSREGELSIYSRVASSKHCHVFQKLHWVILQCSSVPLTIYSNLITSPLCCWLQELQDDLKGWF